MHMMALNSMVWLVLVVLKTGYLEERMITSRRMLITLIAKQRKADSSSSWWIILQTKQKRNNKLWTRRAWQVVTN